MPENAAMRWFALHVRSRHEKAVHSQLKAKQQDVFLPLYAARNKWGDRWRSVSLPLFPGYIFCRFDPADRYSVLATSGVIDVVRVGAEPAPIETREIEAVQLIVSSPVRAAPYADLVTGQKVILTNGPLTGLAGTLTEIRNSCRLVVSIELLCRSVSVEIERDWVVPTDPGKVWDSRDAGGQREFPSLVR
jgi:transcription antitermination factor NusG